MAVVTETEHSDGWPNFWSVNRSEMKDRNDAVGELIEVPARGLPYERLVEGLRNGDARAAEAFYDQFARRINRLVWRLLGADAEHEDVVQQVFANVLTSLDKLRDTGRLDAWISRIAINTVRREIRSRRVRRRALQTAAHCFERATESVGPEREAPVRRFFEVLSTMRADDRIVFALRYVEGYTTDEIASALGVSLATAKRRLARAKRAFARRARQDIHLAGWIGDEEDGRFS